MRTRAHGATCLAAVCLLGGCASSPAVRQAKQNDPIVVVTVQSTPAAKMKAAKNDDTPRKEAILKALQSTEMTSILGALDSSALDDANGVFGGSVGGVIGSGSGGGGFGGLGLSGVGVGGGGTGQGIGLGSIGTIGHGGGSVRAGGSARFSIRGGSSSSKAKLGPVIVSGPLMVDVVQNHIDPHRDEIQGCHRLEESTLGSRWGTATFMFTIDETGHVTDVHVYETNLSSRTMEDCIAHRIGGFEFPLPGAGKTVTVLLPVRF